jgi:proline dehydrogenase
MPKLNQENKDVAQAVFNKVKGSGTDSASLFEIVDALRNLELNATVDELYKENSHFNISFKEFCEIYTRKREETAKGELTVLVMQSFESLGGKANQ